MKLKKSPLLLIAAFVAIGALSVGVIAYMFNQTNVIENEFVPARVACQVDETFSENTGVKKEITIKNTGNTDAYLRVRLVSYWIDADNNVVAKPSEVPEFTLGEGWIEGSNDTYYYESPVSPNNSTPVLGSDMTLVVQDGYRQVVDVFAEAIQSKPTDAVTNSWGVTLDATGNIKTVPTI